MCRYITVGHEQQKRHLYYYLAISERNPRLDPVVIWINGGPACSGFSAFLHSFGKYVLSSDGICSVVSGIVILVTEKRLCSSLSQYVQLIFFYRTF